jgi:predicted membrane protein
MSSFAKAVVGLLVLLVVLVVALLVEGSTHNAIAAWVAVGALFVVVIARWLLV